MVKYRSVRYIFYVVVKFVNLRFIIRIKLVGCIVQLVGFARNRDILREWDSLCC